MKSFDVILFFILFPSFSIVFVVIYYKIQPERSCVYIVDGEKEKRRYIIYRVVRQLWRAVKIRDIETQSRERERFE